MSDVLIEKLSVVLPAYNESENICFTLRDVDDQLSKIGLAYEAIVIDDGSADGTAEAAHNCGIEHVRVVSHSQNQGYGAALRTGFNSATGDYIFFMDSDGQFCMGEFDKLLDVLEQGQSVFGYRRERQDPVLRRLNGKAWTALVNALFGLGVRDIDCAFKLLPGRDVRAISLETSGAMINTELAAKLKARGVRWKQVAVEHFPRKSGTQTGNDLGVIMRAFGELLVFWWKWRVRS